MEDSTLRAALAQAEKDREDLRRECKRLQDEANLARGERALSAAMLLDIKALRAEVARLKGGDAC